MADQVQVAVWKEGAEWELEFLKEGSPSRAVAIHGCWREGGFWEPGDISPLFSLYRLHTVPNINFVTSHQQAVSLTVWRMCGN